LRSALPAEERQTGGGKEYGMIYRSDNPDRRAPVGIEELPSQAEERRMKYRSANQVRGD